jgi:DNA invertase Pin-like site-specific DNA recombinase
MVMAMVAEIERDLNVQRTKAAMETRKALVRDGKTWTSKAGNIVSSLGRPKGIPGPSKLDKHEAAIRERLALGVPVARIAKQHSTTACNLRNWMGKHRIGKDGKDIPEI